MRIARCEILRFETLTARERASLTEPLIDIVQTWYAIDDRAFVAENVVFRQRGWLMICYGADDAVLGFNSIGVSRIRLGAGQEKSRYWMVVDSGIYVRSGVRGVRSRVQRFLLRSIIKLRIRHPLVPFVFVGLCASPVTYVLGATYFAVVHPRPGVVIPHRVTALVQDVMKARGFRPVQADDPWIVALDEPVAMQAPERLEASVEMAQHADAIWYRQRNPHFMDGEWLVIYIPLSWPHLIAFGIPWLRRYLSNRQRPFRI